MVNRWPLSTGIKCLDWAHCSIHFISHNCLIKYCSSMTNAIENTLTFYDAVTKIFTQQTIFHSCSIYTLHVFYGRSLTLDDFTGSYARKNGRLPLLSARPAVASRPKNITVLRPVPSCTDWWQRHIGVNNVPKVVVQLCPSGNGTHDLLIANPTPRHSATALPLQRLMVSQYTHSSKRYERW